MQDHLWESCGSVVSPDDLCRSLICLHRLSGSSVFSSGREDLRCRRLMLVSCHLCDVITWWEQKLSALKIVILSLPPGGATASQLKHHSIHRQVADVVANKDANLAVSPTSRYVSIESSL
ncbi:uncharacterized protein TNCV_454751 [Trichonephila clavipes]|nr:uncharacterized protein TNCV_454751 [Trichonephila clavipes]